MDKLTIRLEAIKLAATFRTQPEDVINVAKKFEEYIIGEADVSEYENPNKVLFDLINKTIKDNDAELKKIEKRLNNMKEEKDFNDVYLQNDDEKVE